MEKKTRDLEALVTSQKEQLTRYEKRLKDVVTAYKGLLKEKEALEATLSAISSSTNENVTLDKGPTTSGNDSVDVATFLPTSGSPSETSDCKSQLQTQIITLMNSLATLSAEKSRMEASFQADKKQLRAHIAQKDQHIVELQAKIKDNIEQAKNNLDEIKAKWIIERQEREKETNNQMLMIRELQKLYADERHLKESIEMQLNNFKTQFASNEGENSRVRELQTKLKEAFAEIKLLQSKTQHYSEAEATSSALEQVQMEMHHLKEQHAVAIKSERRRALRAEDVSRRQAAFHEDRVANLEARLAELSNTVGTYDRLRQQDQENIHDLKKQLQVLDATAYKNMETKTTSAPLNTQDVNALVNEIVRLKKLLMDQNSRNANPIDLTNLFAVGADHIQCQHDLQTLQQQLGNNKTEISALQSKIEMQKSHITTLQEKVKVLNRNIDDQELELRQHSEKLRQAVKTERSKWQNVLTEMENDSRAKINELEQQLQKQRQRSLQLLDEKELEIKTLQTSFEVFHSANNTVGIEASNDVNTYSSDAESVDGGPIQQNSAGNASNKMKVSIKSKKLSLGENCHMLHYQHEIARKDIEIAALRKAKYSAEISLRKAIHEKVTAQQELSEKIEILEEHVDRLERCKTREGANLEYLKNVMISYIVAKDADGKKHMLNAISAVLQLTDSELQIINSAFQKK